MWCSSNRQNISVISFSVSLVQKSSNMLFMLKTDVSHLAVRVWSDKVSTLLLFLEVSVICCLVLFNVLQCHACIYCIISSSDNETSPSSDGILPCLSNNIHTDHRHFTVFRSLMFTMFCQILSYMLQCLTVHPAIQVRDASEHGKSPCQQ